MKTVGEILKNARHKKKLTRRQIAKQTRISLRYLKALEKNDFTSLPEAAFVKGFIRNYANAVELNPQQALAVFRRDYDQNLKGQVIPRSFTQSDIKNRSLWNPKTTVIVAAALLTLTFISYFIYQYRLLESAPPLVIESPMEEEEVTSALTVVANTDPQATVTINNQQVSVESDGTFRQSILLPQGTRTITIQTTSRAGKSRTVQRTIHVVR